MTDYDEIEPIDLNDIVNKINSMFWEIDKMSIKDEYKDRIKLMFEDITDSLYEYDNSR